VVKKSREKNLAKIGKNRQKRPKKDQALTTDMPL